MIEATRATPFIPWVTLVLASMLAGCGGGQTQPLTEAPQAASQQQATSESDVTVASNDATSTEADAQLTQAVASPASTTPVETATDTLKTAQATTTTTAACAATKLDVASVVASAAQDGNPAVNVLDGDLATRWSALGKGVYLTADLGGRKQVCAVTLGWYHGNERTNQFAISASEDGVTFSPLYSGSSAANLALQTYTVTPTTARYVRLTVNGNTVNDWASVTELQVQGGSAGFVHPGVSVSRAQLDFIKAKITAGQEPWATAFKKLQTSGTSSSGQKFASLTYVPRPVAVVKCATAGGRDYIAAHPEQPELKEQGCNEQVQDAIAAYAHALQWYFTGNPAYAQKAIEIMNAWSGTLTTIWFDQPRKADGGFIYGNGKLQAAWTGETITRAAEIIRHTYTPAAGKETFNVPRFSAMLKNVILPLTIDNWKDCCANWLLSTTDATIAIGVFTDDKAVFDNGIGDWRGHVPSAIYLSTDKPTQPQLAGSPIPPPGTNYDKPTTTAATMKTYWKSPSRYIDGLEAETCRDLSHTVMGMEAMAYAAETARIQGIDLWGEQKKRIVAALELNAGYLNAALSGNSSPSNWVCPTSLSVGLGGEGYRLGWEVAYNHFASRLGVSLPQTKAVISRFRPTATALHMDYESLTHSGGTP